MEITLNDDQRVFVFKQSCGYSCMGYDIVFNHCRELAARIIKHKLLPAGVALPPMLESEIGTLKQYQAYQDLIKMVVNRKIGTWFDYTTPGKVRSILEQFRKDDRRIRLFYGDTKTGRCWMEENDVVGRVGRSGGILQIPLLLAEGEGGGPGILDRCIVRIMDADARAELYRHPAFHLPEMEIRPATSNATAAGYTHGVWARTRAGEEFENHANFKSYGKAAQWVAFMHGECMEQP